VKPYYEDGSVTIYNGDSRELLEEMSECPDTVITDPPYSSGGFQEAGKAAGSVGTRGSEAVLLDNLSTRGYERLMREILKHCRSANELYMFTDWRMWTNTADSIEAAGWCVRSMIVWDKGRPGMGRPWRNQHELIAFGLRSSSGITAFQGNVINCDRVGNVNHPTEKPVDLIATLIQQSEGQLILDPFMGGGSTLLAAKRLGRRAVGIEASETHCETAAQRCSQDVLDLEMAA